MKRVYALLLLFSLAVPLGLYLTDAPAWGEWEKSHYKETLGFIPQSIEQSSQSAPLPDYHLPLLGEVPSYYLSALVGILLIFGVFSLLKRFLHHE